MGCWGAFEGGKTALRCGQSWCLVISESQATASESSGELRIPVISFGNHCFRFAPSAYPSVLIKYLQCTNSSLGYVHT